MKNGLKVILFYLVLIAAIIFVVSRVLGTTEQEEIKYSQIQTYFDQEQVDSFVLDKENNLTLTLKGDEKKEVSFELRDYTTFVERILPVAEQQLKDGVIKEYNVEPYETIPWWLSNLPLLIIIVIFVVLWIVMMNQANGKGGPGKLNGFGKAHVKMGTDEKSKVFFPDVAGADEEKEELREVVEYLRDPSRFTRLGARIPRGVLLVGPPGTGKTLLAKAVAGEANVPFYSISGSDFVEMYVGVGASRVRDLFENARKHPAAIIFIDEIDAVGRHRGAGLGGGHDEREQTLNQLLVEMDGFGAHDGTIVMAATNRPDILDPALLRPGRFDRQITVSYPDLMGREQILKVHSKNKPMEKDVDLNRVAQTTVGFTGADLANLMNEAALTAARKGKSLIGMNDIEEATLKIIVGMPKKSHKIKPEEKRKTAYHEAGHAIVAHILPSQDPVTQISVVPSGRALGYTLTPPQEDKFSEYKNEMIEQIAELLGGRVAEKIVFDDVSGGASNDIQRATEIARRMVTKYGMSEKLGPILYGSENSSDEVFLGRDFNQSRNYSEETAAMIDAEIKRFVQMGYVMAETILTANRDKLDFVSEFLTKYEMMDGDQFKAAMEGEPTMEELESMVAEKRRRSEEENERRRQAEEAARKQDEEAARKRDALLRAQQEKQMKNHKDSPQSPLELYRQRMQEEEERQKKGDQPKMTPIMPQKPQEDTSSDEPEEPKETDHNDSTADNGDSNDTTSKNDNSTPKND